MAGVGGGCVIDVKELAKANWGHRDVGLVTLPDAILFAEFVLDSYKESLKEEKG